MDIRPVHRESDAGQGEIMDFIEQVFGFSPDGGSGSFETALVLLAIGIVMRWRWARSARNASR